MALILRHYDDPNLAKKHFYKALEINPEYSLAYYELAHHVEKNGDLNEAKIHFQKASDVDQNFVEAYFNLARILKSPSEYDQAIRNYETALEINPNFAECHYWFAKALTSGERLKSDGSLVKEPNIKKAERHFSIATKLDPKFYKAFYRLGLILKEQGEYINAYKNFEQAIKLNPSFSKVHYSMAVLLMDKRGGSIIEKNLKQKSSKSNK